MPLTLFNGTRQKNAFGAYGVPGVCKSGGVQLGFERALFLGRKMDMHSVADSLGAVRAQSVVELFGEQEPLEWTLDMIQRYIEMLIARWNLPGEVGNQWREVIGRFDVLVIDDASITFRIMIKVIEDEIAAAEKRGERHPYATANLKKDTRTIYREIGSQMERVVQLAGKLPLSFYMIAHERPAGDANGTILPGAPLMPTKKLGVNILASFSLFARVAHNPDWVDPYAEDGIPFHSAFFVRPGDIDWATRDRWGIIKGWGPPDLWSVLEHAGIQHRRAQGREFLDQLVIDTANHAMSICAKSGNFDASVERRVELARWVTEQLKPLERVPADSTSLVPMNWRLNRLVYQQGYGYAYYGFGQQADPLFSALPSLTQAEDPATSNKSGAGSVPFQLPTKKAGAPAATDAASS